MLQVFLRTSVSPTVGAFWQPDGHCKFRVHDAKAPGKCDFILPTPAPTTINCATTSYCNPDWNWAPHLFSFNNMYMGFPVTTYRNSYICLFAINLLLPKYSFQDIGPMFWSNFCWDALMYVLNCLHGLRNKFGKTTPKKMPGPSEFLDIRCSGNLSESTTCRNCCEDQCNFYTYIPPGWCVPSVLSRVWYANAATWDYGENTEGTSPPHCTAVA